MNKAANKAAFLAKAFVPFEGFTTRSLGVRRFFDFFPQNFEDSDFF